MPRRRPVRRASAFPAGHPHRSPFGGNPTQLYRTLSPAGNPSLVSLLAILKALGLRLAVRPLTAPAAA